MAENGDFSPEIALACLCLGAVNGRIGHQRRRKPSDTPENQEKMTIFVCNHLAKGLCESVNIHR
jgi:hypothetical protein